MRSVATLLPNVRVLLDVDGFLLNFVEPALRVVKNITGKPPHPDCYTDWDLFKDYDKKTQNLFFKEFKKKGWCARIPAYPHAEKGVRALRRTGADVYFVTSPMDGPYWAYERTIALTQKFDADRKHVVHTDAKYLVVGDILVDDKPSHIETWKHHHPHGKAILWDQPYNRKFHWEHRATSWDQILSTVVDLRKSHLNRPLPG